MQETEVNLDGRCLQHKVKPYKVGDIVRWHKPDRLPKDEIHTIETIGLVKDHIGISNGYNVHIEELEHWRPRIGDWVWYGFELVRFLDTGKICRQESNSYEEVDDTLLYPFIGELPPCAKEN